MTRTNDARSRARLLAKALLTSSLLALFACIGLEADDQSQSSYGGPPINSAPPNYAPEDEARNSTEAPVSSPFVLTERDPLATFAADVDTASYDIFRRSLLLGSLPARTEVRVEEYVNYFHYDYEPPAADSDVPFTVRLSASAHITGAPTKILRVGIQGAVAEQGRAANLVFLVDVSGSMAAENKLPLVQRVLREALSVLAPTDTVAIVSYAGRTQVELAATPVRERARIHSAIDGLSAGGGTNGGSGIQLAYEEASKAFLEGGINHVVLCTDGDFNLGITSNDALVALIEQKRKSGITLTALGVGERNNDAMMERVSNSGNGIYSVLYNEDQAIAYSHQRLLSSMVHIAKDVKIQVAFNPEHVYAYRLIGYEDRALLDSQFRDDLIDAGEIGSGHQVTALFELALSEQDLPKGILPSSATEESSEAPTAIAAEDLVRVRLRWKKPGASERDEASEALFTLPYDALLEDAAELDRDAIWAIGVATLAEVLRESPYVSTARLGAVGELLRPLVFKSTERAELISLWPAAVRLTAR